MNYYILMNDYTSSIMPRYLHAIVDTKKQVNNNWDYNGSEYSFPYYMKEPECPNQLFLLCNKDIGALKFNYYNHGASHIASDNFIDLFSDLKICEVISKKLIATSIKDGNTLRDDFNYMYFIGDDTFLDSNRSELEEDRLGSLIPHKLTINNPYCIDVFTLRSTLLADFLFLSEYAAEILVKKKVSGVKIIKLDDAFKNYCIDYGYDIERKRKKIKKKLP
ncbi:Imm43 family immunity protein [Photorhabdus sp. APURE]|uniref:Imm43 family immunity protein n=1 Tax=Photorhabdus aballayi TaxID=2991723 RepID=UPI00223CE806|nr:Imm43 family immunity protein [Photorhabdus aballayi]MCW7550941.1 Imm43 family immunity protein [Photorhabdus aballayi]